jgi:hypothetical protein
LKRSRESRKSKKTKKRRKEKIIGECVKVVDKGPNGCVLCGRRFRSHDVKVMIGGHFRHAHMECVTSYSFSAMD